MANWKILRPKSGSSARSAEPARIEPLRQLLLPGDDIICERSLAARVDDLRKGQSDSAAVRSAIVEELTRCRNNAMQRIGEAMGPAMQLSPYAAQKAVRSYAYLTDGIVRTALDLAISGRDSEPDERMCVAAVGGYGRGEMAPHSDVDLLFLVPTKITPWIEAVIEDTLYLLWDLKLKVGHSCRSVKDCIHLGRDDFTIRTALLEHRFIFGDAELATELRESLWNDLFSGTGREFVEAKLAERDERNRRQNGNRYLLEPNVKEGKGGLRDLQTLFWIVKYLHRIDDPRELVNLDVFRVEEFEKFVSSESFLWSVRCHLHILAGRAQDQLHFDVQTDVAERLGYADSHGRPAVEHFMQDYFRYATDVGELTRIFLSKLEAQHAKKEPAVTGFLRSASNRFRGRMAPGFVRVHGRLAIGSEEDFLKDPLNLLRLFEEGLKTGLLLHPDAMRLVAANLHRIDDSFRDDPEAKRIFLSLLLDQGNPERALRRMNELGVLGMFIPEFRRIVAMMQFGSYHHYTVDEHTIQCLSTLSQIERGELVEDLPVASQILQQGINRKVLFVAMMLHDIGKGLDRDHSEAGAEIARGVAHRLGLDESETDLVEWLVANHLLMSDTAQKRDLSDPRTVGDFARHLGNRTRLKLLTVLTVCDIRGVGPGVWNNWKAQLLRDLYGLTHRALTEGLVDNMSALFGTEEAKERFRTAMPDWEPTRIEFEIARHPDAFWSGLSEDVQVEFANMLSGIGNDEIRTDAVLDEQRGATRICFAMLHHPGLFARIAGTLAIAGANVVDAKTFTSTDGFATAIFWVQDAEGRPYEKSRLVRLRKLLDGMTSGELDTGKALRDRDRQKRRTPSVKREQKFEIPTAITIDNEGSEICTIVEVDTRDRPGLLYDLARVQYNSSLSITSAVIATYGAQAVDVFYVKDMFGLKLHSKARRDALEKKLLEAIEKGREEAAP